MDKVATNVAVVLNLAEWEVLTDLISDRRKVLRDDLDDPENELIRAEYTALTGMSSAIEGRIRTVNAPFCKLEASVDEAVHRILEKLSDEVPYSDGGIIKVFVQLSQPGEGNESGLHFWEGWAELEGATDASWPIADVGTRTWYE
jgi:hypothetical protein